MHQAVLLTETLDLLGLKPGGVYVDGTLGDGGHARKIAEATGPTGRLLALDQDGEAIVRVAQRGGEWIERCTLVQANFANLKEVAADHGFNRVDGVLLDLGVSSYQLEAAERGFSFVHDGPLDMRMDQTQPRTAADLLNALPEKELADLLWQYGEERQSRKIARAVGMQREKEKFVRTGQLAHVVEAALGGRRGRIHPATRTFQALRMAVNRELPSLERGLEGGLDILGPGGRLAVIAFHSLEDRIVKRFFVAHAGRWESLAAGGRTWVGTQPEVRLVTRKPVTASEQELGVNPRARSAKLRVAERKA